ncbi:MAG: glutamine amidotransferase [Gammaproteobacteria bacterium]|nr:MAG: glutamine amidotransferase [Gammaproteobacteria bacterium]
MEHARGNGLARLSRGFQSLSLVIVQPGQKLPTLSSVPGDFAEWAITGMGLTPDVATRCQPQRGEPLPSPEQVAGVVITGSGAMVTERAPWMQATEAWIRELVARETPLLGICFGHQLLAQALGGMVGDNSKGIEVGTVLTRLTPEAWRDPLFAGWPAVAQVQASHQQSVLRLPPDAVPLCSSEQDPHHAFRLGSRTWGVQFHPEFDARIVAAYEDYYAPRLDPAYRTRAMTRRADSPWGNELLRAFRHQLSRASSSTFATY